VTRLLANSSSFCDAI